MEKTELTLMLEHITSAYNQLTSSIDEIGKLKSFIQKIPLATEELSKTLNEVLTNVKLKEFQTQNQAASIKVKADIEKIDRDLNLLLSSRHQFVEFIETYKLMIQRFQSTTDEEIKVTNDLIKKVTTLTSNLSTNQTKLNASVQRTNTILEGQEIISKYSLLNKKIQSIEDKLSTIEGLLLAKGK